MKLKLKESVNMDNEKVFFPFMIISIILGMLTLVAVIMILANFVIWQWFTLGFLRYVLVLSIACVGYVLLFCDIKK